MNCVFCKIVAGEIPSNKVYEDDHIFAFHDINPEAPVHIIIIPKAHIASLQDSTEDHVALLGSIQRVAASLAKDLGIDESGYRLVNNCGADGGQSVFHLHYHLIGGKPLGWPPFAPGNKQG